MSLLHLEVRGIRNLTSISLDFSPSLNLIYGANGSGKTSLLEAIHVLGLGRSFRTLQAKKLVQAGLGVATVFGRVDIGGQVWQLGVQKSDADPTLIKINGEIAASAADLAELLPLQLINPESDQLVLGEPKERRAFLDWGLFHVEQNYLEGWRRYRRVLQQRNAALRQGAKDTELGHWDAMLADEGERLSSLRTEYLASLAPPFKTFCQELGLVEHTVAMFRRGWTKELPLLEVLQRNRESDRSAGYTQSGAHRADFRLQLDGQDGADVFSRGQLKLTVCALRLAQAINLFERRGRRCVFMVDDLPAELDPDKRRLLLRALAKAGGQVFVTATERNLVDLADWEQYRMFHVERGVATEVV